MSTITRERAAQIAEGGGFNFDEIAELARIALASLEAEPAIHRWRRVTVEPYGPCPWHYGNFIGFSKPVEGIEDEYFYSAPPAPVSVPNGRAITQHFDTIALETAREIMCDVNRRHEFLGGEVQLLSRIQCRIDDACRAAMLHGADGALTNEGAMPATQFKPVADLYGLTSPTGSETSFTFDAVEARDFFHGGWSVQEYVELERYQQACAGNSPAIPDGWVLVPEEPTHEMLEAGDEQFGTYDVYRRMIAASPQQK
ncbi:TPA: hypothetical protein R4179_002538 [Enterobacter hormaechei subsp. hoffmannii]|uniref:hypothetical protein n=1 Tax=Enterobacter hormaechei TaxID=158836 RepID=UPI0011DCB74B|nr:hypothetical protein [Enterobacter hormaechei]HCJ6306024.1 hypothetical protein [Enterobacter hormaechei subsp. xiangfangensis]HED3659813.1 hypothetical protein [Enterobacter hormaechei subsp. hoffmannii]TXW31414.1 hypothetical protein D4M51_23390 [Enterobacter hormaechei]TXX03895.1 hypothetical protein D4M55_23340 [Enterobacter hormaechei]HED3680095.1 hypothetical protein [Enterobacter hormaechei subsp. hoffmannii]